MILPSDAKCREVMESLADERSLTAWERDFIESNLERQTFSDPQKESVAKLMEKYDV